MSKIKFDYVVAEEVAVEELKDFIEEITVEEITAEEVLSSYPQVVKAIRFGLLLLNGDDSSKKPEYTLREPILTETGGVAYAKLDINTRITFNEKKRLAKGLKKGDDIEIGGRLLAHSTGLTTSLLDKLSRFDFKVLEQLFTVFV
ncbi:hypothetical protein [Mucilaginibacter pedocola]|uniref:Uncharacterized protein n=1 Tax=Mucilaginibacter pedocola TaxID=1792845 RepID=A0A1S9P838_9SPHI|nr:hypothetical protein [Mucilaginibacter pedocola]OOQ57121.1 hypothetical protein BC343_16505 [Mucilaginibacter pedocola]